MRRFFRLIVSLFLFSLMGFFLVNLLPGDPVREALGSTSGVRQEDIQRLRKIHGLDKPLHQRYGIWLGNFLSGNWGKSRTYNLPATTLLKERLANTLILFGGTLALALVLFGMGYGLQSRYGESPPERLSQGLNGLLLCIPPFWLGLMSLFVFGVIWEVFPLGGTGELEEAGALERLKFLVLPATVLAVQHVGQWLRLEKPYSTVLATEGWMMSGQAKGIGKSWLLWHRNQKLVVARLLAVWGVDLPMLLGTSIITETVFNWPGVARLLYESVMGKDSDLAMACLMFLGLLTLLANLMADRLLPILDPRARGEA